MIKPFRRSSLAAVALAVIATPLLAAPTDIVRTRIDGFRELGASFKSVNDGTRGEVQTVLVQQAARQIRNTALAMPNWFPAGSGPKPGVKTYTKAEVWTKPVEFRAAQNAFIAQANAFQRAANSGNAAAIRAEARKLGGTCKGCHDSFRIPKD